MSIFVATSSAEIEIEVRRSRFIAKAQPVTSETEALLWIKNQSDRSATHNCWAFRLETLLRCCDDGEPGGTAGRPILAAMEHADLIDVAVLVVRHFGGIKLGTGGLSRAYGAAASECLSGVARVEKIATATIRLSVPFHMTGAVFGLLTSCQAVRLSEDYGNNGLTMTLVLPERHVAGFRRLVTDTTRGAVHFVE